MGGETKKRRKKTSGGIGGGGEKEVVQEIGQTDNKGVNDGGGGREREMGNGRSSR